MGLDRISESILGKVKTEAGEIIRDAERKALEAVSKAKKQHQMRIEGEKTKLFEGAKNESARILAQTSIKIRQQMLAAKTQVIDDIASKVKKELARTAVDEGVYLRLIREAITAVGTDRVKIYVTPKHVTEVQKIIDKDKELPGKVTEVSEYPTIGGVIVEDSMGKIRIDNTFETRLEMLLPHLLPSINEELFKYL
jgi:vacuolar-type H+-ATPase subunit E/Vma4